MVELNIANFVTIGLISVAFYAVLQWALTQFNINIPFLSA